MPSCPTFDLDCFRARRLSGGESPNDPNNLVFRPGLTIAGKTLPAFRRGNRVLSAVRDTARLRVGRAQRIGGKPCAPDSHRRCRQCMMGMPAESHRAAIARRLPIVRDKSVNIHQPRQSVFRPFRHARDNHSGVAVTDQNHFLQPFVADYAAHILDVRFQIHLSRQLMRMRAQTCQCRDINAMPCFFQFRHNPIPGRCTLPDAMHQHNVRHCRTSSLSVLQHGSA
jgi:hypothetical protein